jgi:nitronate monooxygenase
MLKTKITELLNIKYPIISGPMFLVSNEEMVANVSNAGGLGATPSLNWRTTKEFEKAVQTIKSKTDKPFAVNLIVNQSNIRLKADLEVCIKEKVPVIITSLGNPKEVIEEMHKIGSKVFCDVTTLDYAKKVESLGADAVIAVSQGAGGHAGNISPLVLIPYLKENLKIPVITAGGIATGKQIAAALILGADAVQLGTRFIATVEAKVSKSYKDAIIKAKPEDIVLTEKISGTPAAVINTDYIKKIGLKLNPIEKMLYQNPKTKKWVKLMRSYLGATALSKAAKNPTWKEVWSAGQSVALINEILTCEGVINKLVQETKDTIENFCKN